MTPLEEKICQRIYEFDVYALLQLLYSMGYHQEEIFFKSNFPPVSPPSLLEKIEFRVKPIRQVVITINMGLFGALSPLPSYFIRTIENVGGGEIPVLTFLGFFDHNLLQNYLKSIYPELDNSLYPDWESNKRSYFRLLEFHATTFLHRLFQLVFPELGVAVQKSQHKRQIRSGGIRLGETILGDATVLGAYASVALPGFDITLYCDEEYGDKRNTWADKVVKRLYATIFPILKEIDIDLKIFLVIRSQKGWMQLQKESSIGVDKLRSDVEQNRIVTLFRGLVT